MTAPTSTLAALPGELLPRATARHCADQCRQLGLSVGDVIDGREDHGGGIWNEARLTLIFLGAEVAVWQESARNWRHPKWQDSGESANWTLEFRQWRRVAGPSAPPSPSNQRLRAGRAA